MGHPASVGWVLFAGAIFASAFLIFGVQPMVGKHVLPWFGGAPAVWMTCLAFYQTALFAGYAYAHWLVSKVPLRGQPWLHALFFVGSLAVLPVLPGAEWKPEPGADAGLRILAMLSAHVGLPFVLLAATGPLLQAWFARVLPGRSPYPLYAVSNLGSLLGLLSFPLVVEPQLPLSLQSRVWSWGFVATGLAVLACAVWASRSAADTSVASPRVAREQPDRGLLVLWILFPASAVVLFMGVTNRLCLDVASVPFLWIVPLAVYLVTLILCFGTERIYRREVFVTLGIASLAVSAVAGDWGPFAQTVDSAGSVTAVAVRACVALFFGCMVAHGELHRTRPGAARLTAFYLCVAGGGALGGLFVGLLAPRVFDAYHELPLAVAACFVLTAFAIARSPSGAFAGRLRSAAWGALALLSAGMLGAFVLASVRTEPGTLVVERNFFGILRVIETPGRTPFIVLRHGTVRPGLQDQQPPLRQQPTAYYGQTTGVGLVLAERTHAGAPPVRVGVVGLGIGTLAAYGRRGDQIVFYEIDPTVVRLARDAGYFHYLADSGAETEIVLGDARLSLEAELARGTRRAFDVLVVDAFTSDSVPLHLLTAEAFHVYAAHLAKRGVLAIHVSNRNLDLTAPVARLGLEVGLQPSVVVNRDAPRRLAEHARWVLLARDPAYLAVLEAESARFPDGAGPALVRVILPEPSHLAQTPLWTDDFSNVLSLLRRSPIAR